MKIVLLSILLFISFTSFAQIKQGSIALGGDVSFSGGNYSSSQPNSGSQNNYGGSISLLAGKAVKENLFLGGGVNYAGAKNKSTSSTSEVSEQNSHAYGAFIWTRKYYPVLKSFYLFINGNLGVSFNNYEQKSTGALTQKQTGTTISAAILPGISYQMKKNFFLDAAINNLANVYYSTSKTNFKDNQGNTSSTTKNNNWGFSSSIGNGTNPLQIGMRWIISKS